jgi:hypothetical protein
MSATPREPGCDMYLPAWLVKSNLADHAMSVPNKLALADAAINFWWNVANDEDCMQSETNLQAGWHGFEVWKLASALRSCYGIPPTSLTDGTWDFVNTLKEKHAAAESKRRDKSDVT